VDSLQRIRPEPVQMPGNRVPYASVLRLFELGNGADHDWPVLPVRGGEHSGGHGPISALDAQGEGQCLRAFQPRAGGTGTISRVAVVVDCDRGRAGEWKR